MKKRQVNPKQKNGWTEEEEAREPEVLKRDIGMTWKTALPGLGILGLAGAVSALAVRRWRQAMAAIKGERL